MRYGAKYGDPWYDDYVQNRRLSSVCFILTSKQFQFNKCVDENKDTFLH